MSLSAPSNKKMVASGSAEPDRSLDERKIRRMISNRESARRSRMRKQLYLEELWSAVNRLRDENRELSGRLGAVRHCTQLLRIDNRSLRSESAYLRCRLQEFRRLALLAQLQRMTSACGGGGGFAAANGQNIPSSLIV